MAYNYGNWTQIRVTVKTELLDTVVSIMSMIDSNLMIEDFSDVSLESCHADFIDDEILQKDKTVASVSVYISSETPYADAVSFIKERLAAENIDAKPEIIGVNEEEWANAWKSYYKPIKIGEHIVVVPAWESYTPKPDDVIIEMDPGMSFGTGTHESTRLVMRFLEKYVKPGAKVLDVGCGSGILAICAAKLGAGECAAYDIDPVSVEVAQENAVKNGVPQILCKRSDLLRDVPIPDKKYDIVCANIVADIVIRLSDDVKDYMSDDAVLLASGIVDIRRDDVVRELAKRGLTAAEELDENGWSAILFKRA